VIALGDDLAAARDVEPGEMAKQSGHGGVSPDVDVPHASMPRTVQKRVWRGILHGCATGC
jgi:hypothetical protein